MVNPQTDLIVRVVSLSKSYGGNRVLQNVSLSLRRGELVALIGPNGSGKTTLLDAICGLIPADEGTVLLDHQDCSKVAAPHRARRWLARTFQKVKLARELTATQNVMVQVRGQRGVGLIAAALRRRTWADQEADVQRLASGCLVAHGLGDGTTKLAGALSFGQAKIVAFCGAALSGMPILALDEPFTGLDTRRAQLLGNALVGMASEGTAILFVEHNLTVVARLAHRVVALHEGAVIEDGPPESVLGSAALRKAYVG